MKIIFLSVAIFTVAFSSNANNNVLKAHAEPENGSCLNNFSAKIFGSATGGTPPYSFLWSSDDSTRVIENLADGTYSVTVTDAKQSISVAEASVRTSQDICCNTAGNPFPQFPESSIINNGVAYDVNLAPSHEVGFYDEKLSLSNNSLYIAEGVPLIVHDGALLLLENCTLQACGNMWKGIVVESGGTLIMMNSTIKDAEYGIYAKDGAKFYVYKSKFQDNVISIETAPNDLGKFNDIDYAVAATTFDFSGSFHDPYPEQPSFGTKPRAGIEFNNMLGTIGDYNFTENIFSNLNCGIISYASTLRILNSKFLHITNDLYYTESFMGSGIAAIGDNGFYSVDVLPDGNMTADNPTFNDCDYGVFGSNLSLSVTGCYMSAVGTGVYAIRCGRKNSITVKENNISAIHSGVKFYNNEGANRCYAGYNTIVATDRRGECIGAYESGRGQNNLTIEENDLYNTGSISGINISGCYGSFVFHNQVHETFPGMNGFYGIGVYGCELPKISCNSVVGHDNAVDHNSFGVRINVSENSILHCNIVDQTSRGIGFFGPCATKDNIDDNEMNGHFEGLYLNSNAIIGTQSHTGNRWIGNFSSGYGANNFNSTSAGLAASQFIVHTDPSTIFYPSIPSYDNSWFITQAGSPYSCADLSECPDGSSGDGSAGNLDLLDYYIANNYFLSDDFKPETKAMARQYLYQKLTLYPALIGSNSTLQNFYQTYSNSSTGELQQVKDNISGLDNFSAYFITSIHTMDSVMRVLSDSILYLDKLTNSDILNAGTYVNQKESLRLQATTLQNSITIMKLQFESLRANSAIAIANTNESIAAIQLPENNDKVINEIYLQAIASGSYAIEESQKNTLLAVALQCPFSGGKSVYRARTLYQLIDPNIEYNDDSTCLAQGIYRLKKENHYQENISLKPNPANDLVTVFYTASSSDCMLYLTDISGQIIKMISLASNQSKYEFSVSDMAPGFYLVNVVDGKTSIGRSKLAVSR